MEKQQATHITMPIEVFNKVMNTVGSMPYVQVAGLIKEVEQHSQAVSNNQPAPESSEKEV